MFHASIYQARRDALLGLLRAAGVRGLVLLPGLNESPMNYAHNCYPFRQDSSFLYFFGLDQPGLAATLDIDEGTAAIYGDDLSIDDIVWTGPLPSVAERAAGAGVNLTAPLAVLADRLGTTWRSGRPVHYLPPYRAETVEQLSQWLERTPAAVRGGASKALITAVVALRERKGKEEIAEMETALAVTADMHHAAMRLSRPGTVEREVVGAMEGIMRARDWQLAYPVIFSKRGEVLHNHDHSQTLAAGDLIVNDTGCSSPQSYASDITRTIPVGGRFSPLQRELYDVVLDAQQAVIAALQPGVPFIDMHRLACRILVEGLKAHGCFRGDAEEIVQSGAYAVFFQCGLGHQIGLDVHDMEGLGEDFVGYGNGYARNPMFGMKSLRLAKPVVEGMVVTVEPGIYVIPELLDQWRAQGKFTEFIDYNACDRLRGFGGIRIEDDVLITASGHRVLGPHIARTADEVEAVMAS